MGKLSCSPRNKKMLKTGLINIVAIRTNLTKGQTRKVVDSFISTITESLSEGTYIDIRGFGSFRVRERNARTGINPKPGQKISIPAKKVPYFRAGKSLKLIVDKNINERDMNNNNQ
jgi:integration host factor subunit beta